MIYELRDYVASPGRAAELHARFRDHTFDLFERHGMQVVGFWNDSDDPHRITYLLGFADADAQAGAWEGFQSDPDWKAAKAASEADGPIVSEMTSRTLLNPSYWAHETTASDRGERSR